MTREEPPTRHVGRGSSLDHPPWLGRNVAGESHRTIHGTKCWFRIANRLQDWGGNLLVIRGPPRDCPAATWLQGSNGEPPHCPQDTALLPHRQQGANLQKGTSAVPGLPPLPLYRRRAARTVERGVGGHGWDRNYRAYVTSTIRVKLLSDKNYV